MKSKVFSFLIGLFAMTATHANHSLSGTVLDASTGKPIQNAEVYNKTTNQLVSTDKDGFFKMENLPKGAHQIVIVSFEYETMEKTIVIKEDVNISIPMVIFQDELTEVVISERREEIFALNRLNPVEGTSIFAGKKSEVVLLDQLVGNTAANNARQIYSQVVGLNIYESVDAGLQLNVGGRGLDPNRTANFNTRQNGYDISADVLGYPESYYTPPAEALREIQVVRGAASLQYGTQFGGLLNFKMKSPSKRSLELLTRQSIGSFGLFNSFNSLSGTKGNFSYYSYYNHKSGNGFRENSGFNSNNIFGNFNYQLSEHTRLSFDVTYMYYLAQQAGGLTDEQFYADPSFTNRTRNWMEIDWKLAAMKLDHDFSSRSSLSFMLFGLDAKRNSLGFRGDPTRPLDNPITFVDEQNPDGSFVNPRDLIKGHFKNWGAETKFLTRYQLGSVNSVLMVGAKYYRAYNTSRQGPGTNGTDANFAFDTETYPDYVNQSDFIFPNENLALFGEHIFFVNDKLSITPGFRFEHIKTESEGVYNMEAIDLTFNAIPNGDTTDNRSFSRSFVLFGVGMSYEPSENAEFYANISENYRSVTFSDIRVTNPSFVVDPFIKDESGYTFDLGVRGKWLKFLSYDIGAFSLLYDNRIGIVLDDRANRVRGNIGSALTYGLEFYTDWNVLEVLNQKASQTKLNWFVNASLTDSKYLSSEVENVVGKKVEFIPAVNLKTGLRFGYRNLMGSFQFTNLSKQYTDVENSEVVREGSRAGLIGPIPAYSIMDLSFSYSLKKWKIETGVNNLLDEKYFTRRATGYPGPGIIPSDPRSYYLTLQFKL